MADNYLLPLPRARDHGFVAANKKLLLSLLTKKGLLLLLGVVPR